MLRITVVLLSVFAFGVSGGQYELNGIKKQRLEGTIKHACRHLPDDRQSQITALTMAAVGCLYESFDKSMLPQQSENETMRNQYLEAAMELCSLREKLLSCGRQVLDFLAPCTSAQVQVQIEDMKVAVKDFISFICDEDMTKLRGFINDGAYECIEKRSSKIDSCVANISSLITEFPEDTKSFEAIEACYRYDEMTPCLLTTVAECPKASTKQFIESLLSLFRSGTYCHATLPLKGNEV